MPFYYFDSTALVKRYNPERGTRTVNALLSKRGKTAIIATTTLAEFYAVLASQARQGELTRDDWYSVIFKFETESQSSRRSHRFRERLTHAILLLRFHGLGEALQP